MKISYKWLKELVDLDDISYQKLVDDLSLYIVEVDETSHLTYGTNLITARVKSCVPHPDSDHLHVCMVDTGSEMLQIVCGAPNVDKDQTIILALPGAELMKGSIKKSVIRGVESNGMICSLEELNLEHKFIPKEYQDGIYVLPDDTPLGVPALKYLGLDDEIIDLGLTPNRMDLMSMYGVANDVAALYRREKYIENGELQESSKKSSDEVEVELDTDKCLSYNARVIKNVEIKESPTFIKSRLMASGIRPINNVVDITNYILMLFGQPLHAFDQDILGNKIVVRLAKDNEKVVTLDDIERTLSSDDIVITDGKNVTCIAGIMGCSNTEVTNNTKNVVLEAAIFDSLSVRKTSSKLGLRSDSSVRFERGVDVNRTKQAIDYAAYLLSKYANGTVLKGTVSKGIDHIDDTIVDISLKDVQDYLGVEISEEELIDIFESLEFKVEKEKELKVYVPNRRMDIKIKADLIEEVARFYGYENLKLTLPRMENTGSLTIRQSREKQIRHILSDLGLNEVVTYALVSKEFNQQFPSLYKEAKEIELMHPMSEEHMVLRRSLIPSIIDVEKYNSARKLTDLALFEIGNVYYHQGEEDIQERYLSILLTGKFDGSTWNGSNNSVDFYTLKGILEMLAERLGIKLSFQKMEKVGENLHPGRSAIVKFQNEMVGYISALHPGYLQANDLADTYILELNLEKILNQKSQKIKFTKLVKKPTVVRDIALIMDKEVQVGDVMENIYRSAKNMISKVEVFDLFIPPLLINKKSVAFKIYFESDDALTDEIINEKLVKILDNLEIKFKAVIRK